MIQRMRRRGHGLSLYMSAGLRSSATQFKMKAQQIRAECSQEIRART
jgi:hypothetical protein